MKHFPKWLMGSIVILASACSLLTTSIEQDHANATVLPLDGEHAVMLSAQHWLSYGPENTIQLSDNQFNFNANVSMRAEMMDHRVEDGKTHVFTINEKGQPSLITNDSANLSIKYGKPITTPLEAVCLYGGANSPLQVFLLDENHMAQQYYIKEHNDAIELVFLRALPMPPGAEYCAVHDDTNQLFVSEEDIGVWVYSARAESEVKRTPVDLVAPYGNLIENSGPLAIVDNQLFIAELGTFVVHQVNIEQSDYTRVKTIQLDSDIELDSLTAKYLNDLVTFTAVNDNNGQLITWSVPFTKHPAPSRHIKKIKALVETDSVSTKGDAADDPAIWVHKTKAEKSLILGTNKKRGLYVYDLEGKQKQELLVGRVNNVDVRQGFTHKGKASDIAAASQRDRNTIALFDINPSTGFIKTANEIKTGLDHVYGLCMYKGENDLIYVYINDTDGRFEQWHIKDSTKGWQGIKVREFSVASQPEGCTTDEDQQRLFVGEENAAVWTLGAEPQDNTKMELVSKVGDILTADIEGMEIYNGKNEKWLVVSSQGNDSYVVFQAIAPYKPMGEFRIILNDQLGIDGASETDGLTVSPVHFNKQFPEGLLVVQDGRNFLPVENQNYKLVSWRDVRLALNL